MNTKTLATKGRAIIWSRIHQNMETSKHKRTRIFYSISKAHLCGKINFVFCKFGQILQILGVNLSICHYKNIDISVVPEKLLSSNKQCENIILCSNKTTQMYVQKHDASVPHF